MKITPEANEELTVEITNHINDLHLSEKSTDKKKDDTSDADIKVTERGPDRNNVWGGSTNRTPYERCQTSRLLLSGGMQIITPTLDDIYDMPSVDNVRTPYIQEIPNIRKQISVLDEIEELLKADDGIQVEEFYREMQKLCRDSEENPNHIEPLGPNIPDDVLEMVFEKEKAAEPSANVSNRCNTDVSQVAGLCISLCQPQVLPVMNIVPIKNVNKMPALIFPKSDPQNNNSNHLQVCIPDKTSPTKMKNPGKDEHHKKFLKYDREKGLGSRDKFNCTILMVEIMNKRAGFAIFFVNKIKNCFQRCQTSKLTGIESTESYINARDNNGQTALYYAALYNLPDVIKCLITLGADPNAAETQEGNSPLHVAANRGHRYVDVVKELCIAPQININMCNKNGKTALHTAVESHDMLHDNDSEDFHEKIESYSVIKQLLEKNAKLTVQDKDGKTPLHLTVERCKYELIEVLHTNSRDWSETVNMGDKNGFSALHMAAVLPVEESIQMKIISNLLSRDAKSTVKDSQGMIPAQLVSPEKKDVIDLLKHFWSQVRLVKITS